MTPRTLPLSDDGPGAGHVRLLEAGQGEPLLLLHGVGLRAEAWEPQAEALAGTHRVVAVDLPGHGGSSPLGPEARLPDFVAWAGRLVRALGLGPVNLAGHSMGAMIAAGLAVEEPALVRRLAVLNAVFRRSPEARAAVLARAEAIAAGNAGVEAPLDRWFGDAVTDRAARPRVAGWLAAVDRGGYATAYRAFAEGDETYAARLGEIACPVLVLTGAEDLNSTPAMAHAIAATAPRARVVVVEGHRHMAGLTAPEAVSAAMADWLATPVTGWATGPRVEVRA